MTNELHKNPCWLTIAALESAFSLVVNYDVRIFLSSNTKQVGDSCGPLHLPPLQVFFIPPR